jgi:2-oxo-4-hydroxy-4-carboxy-5-ureidoimidazoline decarboxylase
MTTVSLATLNSADKKSFVAALGDVYEQAPWVAEAVQGQRPFASLNALHEAMAAAVRAATAEQRIALLKGHPDLAGKAVRAGTVTADSKAEQASAGLDRLNEAEYAAFHRFSDAYRKKFGIPFIVCVRRHSKDSILRLFERRLQNGVAAETKAALTEVFRIGALRLDQKVEAADKLKVHGRLSTHVLDNHAGHPASGVTVELAELAGHGPPRTIASATTNLEGRTDQPLIVGRPIPIGRYELRFHVGDYFARLGTPQGDPPFLDVVPVQFAVAEAEGHYHVPLLVTPWSYSTYRGS